MQPNPWATILISLGVTAASASIAAADPSTTVDLAEPHPPTIGFVEAFGNWGVNFGQTDYVPDGRPFTTKYPFANGFGGGVTVGLIVLPDWMSVILDYRYAHTGTRTGSLNGVLSNVQGTLDSHSFTAGIRVENRLGPGSVYSEMALGTLLPFHTTIELEYVPGLAAIGIAGKGTKTDDYRYALGGHAELGYHYDLPLRLYVGLGIRIATFQGSNAGKRTTLENFVTDFTAPVPMTTSFGHSTDGPIAPTTYSVQDIRLNLSFGYRF